MQNTHARDNLNALYDDHGIITSRVRFAGELAVTLSATQNNWNPTGLATLSTLEIDLSGGNQAITGIVAQPAGTFLWLIHVGVASQININHESGSSTDVNRIINRSAATLVLDPNESCSLRYSGTLSRWVVLTN